MHTACGIGGKLLVRVVRKRLQREEQTFIALLYECQYTDSGPSILFRDGNDHTEVSFEKANACRLRFYIVGQDMLGKLDLFIFRQLRDIARFPQVNLDGII